MVRSGTKLFRMKTLLNFAPLELVFQKTRFLFEFFYKITPHLFYGPNGLDGAIGGESDPERRFILPKKHVFSRDFLTKPAPYDANLNRHALRPSKQYWITCPRKLKSEFDRTPQPNVYK